MPVPLLLDMVTYLTKHGLAKGDGIDIFRDFSPAEPDDIVVLAEYKGEPSVPYEDLVHRSVQITTRSKDADKARAKAVAIYKSLISDEETQVIHFTTERWGQVYLRQPPSLLHRDESGRTVYFFNTGITTNLY